MNGVGMSDQGQIATVYDALGTPDEGGTVYVAHAQIRQALAEHLVRLGFGSVEAARDEGRSDAEALLVRYAGAFDDVVAERNAVNDAKVRWRARAERAEAALATAKAEALEEAADHIDEAELWRWLNPARGVAIFLRDRAARLRGEGE